MAGIFANIDSDISKLRQLKTEIENVKKALKSINVKVDIDIAQGLEAKLKSLTGQYDALVQKVSQAEGKIIASTQRINQAAEKIVKAQEQLAKASGVQSNASSNGGTMAAANQAETASVQAQAKAYDELADEIDAVMGTRSQNIKRMLEEQNAIRLINAEIKNLTKYQGDNASISSSQQRRLEQLNASLMNHKTALSELRQSLNNSFKLDNSAATSMNALSQSLGRMRMAYRELTEEERKSPFGQELLASIQQADAKIKQLDATIGNHQRNVGNYASSWNGLGMSIQQIGRELPSLAMGWNTFFLAISNNLPILTDEIKRAKDEYNNLKKSGKSATPVWKQVVSSLLSWQTALTVGITLLTLYGDEIINWVSGLFSAKKALSDTYKATEEFQKSVSESSGKILTTIERLSTEWKKLGGNIEEQKKYILENKEAFDSTGMSINNVADAENLLVKNKDAFINAIIEKSKATSIMELASQEYEKYIQKMLEAEERAEKGVTFGDRFKSFMAKSAAGEDLSGSLRDADLSPEAYAKEAVKNLEKNAEDYRKSMVELMKKALAIDDKSNKEIKDAGGETEDTLIAGSIGAIEKSISLKREALKKVTNRSDYAKIEAEIKAEQAKLNVITGNTTKQDNAITSQQSRIDELEQRQARERIRQQIDLENQVDQARIDAMADGSEKVLAQRNLDNKKELEAIERQKEEYKQKVIQMQKEVFDAQEELKAKQNPNYKIKSFDSSSVSVDTSMFDTIYGFTQEKQSNERLQKEREAMNRYLQEYGTFQQKREAIAQEYSQKIANTTIEGEKLLLQKQMEEALSGIDFEKLKGEINWSAVFGNISAYTKKELEKVKAQLDTFKASDEYKGFSPENKEDVENALTEIQSAIDEKGGIFDAVISSMERYKEACEELTAAQNEYNEALASGDEEAIEAARTKVNQAERKKSDAGADVNEAKGSVQNKLIGVANAIAQLGSSSEMSLSSIGSLAESVSSMFGELGGKIGGWIGAAFSVLDVIGKEGVEGFTKNLNESLGSALTSLLEFGTFNLIDFGGLSNRNVDSQLETLSASNENLVQALDRLSEKMDDSSVAELPEIYEKQMANLNEQMRNTQQQMQLAGDVHDDGFLGIGGSHSSNYKVDKGMTAEDWRKISEAAGRSVQSAADFWTLSSEEMYRVADEATTQYGKIKELADDGARNASQYMDQYIGYYEEAEEAQRKYYEALTDVSFDTVRDNFKDALLNMKDDAADFSKDLEEMLRNAVAEAITGEFNDDIEEWYEKFGEYMSTNGGIEPWEANDLRATWDNIVAQGREKMQYMNDVLGFEDDESTPAQQASSAVTVQASQESIDEGNGRLLAIQETGLQMLTQTTQQGLAITDIKGNIIAISASMLKMENIGENVRDILAESYIELQEINENTGNSAKYLKDIKEDIAIVKQNTSRL